MIEHFADSPQLSWACLSRLLLLQVASDSARSARLDQAAASDSARCLWPLFDSLPIIACVLQRLSKAARYFGLENWHSAIPMDHFERSTERDDFPLGMIPSQSSKTKLVAYAKNSPSTALAKSALLSDEFVASIELATLLQYLSGSQLGSRTAASTYCFWVRLSSLASLHAFLVPLY